MPGDPHNFNTLKFIAIELIPWLYSEHEFNHILNYSTGFFMCKIGFSCAFKCKEPLVQQLFHRKEMVSVKERYSPHTQKFVPFVFFSTILHIIFFLLRSQLQNIISNSWRRFTSPWFFCRFIIPFNRLHKKKMKKC